MRNPEEKNIYETVAGALAKIEAEMNRIGYWQTEPLPAEAYDFRQAFAADTMAFSQWLQFIFIPRVKQIIAEKGEFPTQSQVGVMAMREFDGSTEAGNLVTLLSEFDELFG